MLYRGADLILADESVSAMDPVLASHTLGLLNREAQRRSATLLASLHAVELALEHFRASSVWDGRILFDKPATEIGRASWLRCTPTSSSNTRRHRHQRRACS